MALPLNVPPDFAFLIKLLMSFLSSSLIGLSGSIFLGLKVSPDFSVSRIASKASCYISWVFALTLLFFLPDIKTLL